MSDLYESIELRRRLTEADLLTGAEALAAMAVDGMPRMLRDAGCEPPERVLDRLCEQIAPKDFLGGAAPLWGAFRDNWRARADRERVTLDGALMRCGAMSKSRAKTALGFARTHGMGVPYGAPVAAARLLALSVCLETLRETQEIAARVVAEAREAFDGVV